MNDNRDSVPEPSDETALNEQLARLKQLQPPLETRVANHIAVAQALAELKRMPHQCQLPWWRRSISLPVPVAASVALLAAMSLASSFRNWPEESRIHASAPQHAGQNNAGNRGEHLTVAKHAPRPAAELRYYETETYLCGVGRLSSETGYFYKEQNHE